MTDDSTRRSEPIPGSDPSKKKRRRRRRRKRTGEEANKLADEIRQLEAYEKAEMATFGFKARDKPPEPDEEDFERTSTMRVSASDLKELEATIKARGLRFLEESDEDDDE